MKFRIKSKILKAVRDPQSIFRPKVYRDRTKYTRKIKHKKAGEEYD